MIDLPYSLVVHRLIGRYHAGRRGLLRRQATNMAEPITSSSSEPGSGATYSRPKALAPEAIGTGEPIRLPVCVSIL